MLSLTFTTFMVSDTTEMFQFSTCLFFNQPANPTLIITQTCMFFYASQKSVKKGSFSSGALQFSCPSSIRLPSDLPSWQRHTWGIALLGSAGQRLLHTVACHQPPPVTYLCNQPGCKMRFQLLITQFTTFSCAMSQFMGTALFSLAGMSLVVL